VHSNCLVETHYNDAARTERSSRAAMDTIVTVTGTMIVKGLAAGYGEEELFAGLDLVVAPGDVIGLVGANGAGKSTLLRTLAGLHGPEGGTIALSPPTATVGYLPQEPERRLGETVAGYLARRTGVAVAQVALDAAAAALAVGEPGADNAYTTALERWLDLGGADL
jgi:ATPase subunit of ABC transporter with duplicated ATPase domains